jgi:hypothetical protein
MEKAEIKQKLDQLEALKGNVFCEVCDSYVKKHILCNTDEDFDKCPRLRSPKEYKDTCPHCNLKIENYLALGGHIVTCIKNPKREERNTKISEGHKGLKHSEECKDKISKSMEEYHESVDKVEEEVTQNITVGDKNIDITFY